MKKIMYIAAALLVLVGCQKSQEAKENAPVNYGTITGKIELPQGPNKIAAPGGWQSIESGDFKMQWEKGDKIYIFNYEKGEYKLLTLKSIGENGVATFEGELLSDMNAGYSVAYGYNPSEIQEKTSFNVPYVEGNYHPFAEGYGTGESFTLGTFHTVLGLPLKGTDALTKIEIIIALTDKGTFTNTMAFGTTLQLTSTSQTIYFPTMSDVGNPITLTFNFYNAEGLIMTKTVNNVNYYMGQVVTFESELEVKAAPAPTYEYVDLGLSVNWATMNVGATKPEEYGDYFAWGETSPKEVYNWSTYFDTNDGGSTFTKYNIFDGKITLEDDAAHVNWGGNWRMPTKEEQYDLQDYCTWTWTIDYNNTGIAGYIVKSKANTNSIFLPAAGYYDNASLCQDGVYGVYWTSLFNVPTASVLCFHSSDKYWSQNYRYFGLSVRPVCPKGE